MGSLLAFHMIHVFALLGAALHIISISLALPFRLEILVVYVIYIFLYQGRQL